MELQRVIDEFLGYNQIEKCASKLTLDAYRSDLKCFARHWVGLGLRRAPPFDERGAANPIYVGSRDRDRGSPCSEDPAPFFTGSAESTPPRAPGLQQRKFGSDVARSHAPDS